jgi:hypothetical protein
MRPKPGRAWRPRPAKSASEARSSCPRYACRRRRSGISGQARSFPRGLPANTLPEWRVGGQVLLRAEAVRQGLHRAARIASRMERTEP